MHHLNLLKLNHLNIKNYFSVLFLYILSKKRAIVKISAVLLVLAGLGIFINSSSTGNVNTGGTSKAIDSRVQIQDAKLTAPLNKDFTYPIKDNSGKVISKIGYTIESVELRNEIIVKGQRATAIKGREFLILNLKIRNESNKSIQINTRDYVRLSLNNDDKDWLAPDIYNDPVEIQASSTKQTRLGFPISDNDQNIKLRVGEIDGEKTTLDLYL